MGSSTNKKALYKPTPEQEKGWGGLVNGNMDKLDDFYIVKGADVISEAALFTTNGFPTDGNYFDIPSGVTVTSILTSGRLNSIIFLRTDVPISFTHHATNLFLPGGQNITTIAGEVLGLIEDASGQWRLWVRTNPAYIDSPVLITPTIASLINATHDHADAGGGGNLGAVQATDLTITGSAASPPDSNTLVKDNIIKGWINFDGTGTIAERDSYNVSSIVDNGTGDYTINWDTDFADVNYCVVFGCNSGGTSLDVRNWPWIIAVAVDSLQIGSGNGTSYTDYSIINVLAIGAQ